MQTFNNWLKELRKSLGLTQAAAAKKIGCGLQQATYSLLETGKRPIDAAMFSAIKLAFGEPPADVDPTLVWATNLTTGTTAAQAPVSPTTATTTAQKEVEKSFMVSIDADTYVTADKYQFVLVHKRIPSYYGSLKSLAKTLTGFLVREENVQSLTDMIAALERAEKKIDDIVTNNIHEFQVLANKCAAADNKNV